MAIAVSVAMAHSPPSLSEGAAPVRFVEELIDCLRRYPEHEQSTFIGYLEELLPCLKLKPAKALSVLLYVGINDPKSVDAAAGVQGFAVTSVLWALYW